MLVFLKNFCTPRLAEPAKASNSGAANTNRVQPYLSLPGPFHRALIDYRRTGCFAIIAEICANNLARGPLGSMSDAALARNLASQGAACLSVATDRIGTRDPGRLFRTARRACTLPLLRSEPISHPSQIRESRVWGADCVVLAVAGLTDAAARGLIRAAVSLCMDVMIEVNSRTDIERASRLGCRLVLVDAGTETGLRNIASDIPLGLLMVCKNVSASPTAFERLSLSGASTFLAGGRAVSPRDPDLALSRFSRISSDPTGLGEQGLPAFSEIRSLVATVHSHARDWRRQNSESDGCVS